MMGAEFFDVRPRYTCGSPAAVPERIARQVAKEEREAYQHSLDGVHGRDRAQQAEREGLAGIAIYMKETRTGWVVFDLITERWSEWPFTATCPVCKEKKVRCSRGVIGPHAWGCRGEGVYVGRDVTDTDKYRGRTL